MGSREIPIDPALESNPLEELSRRTLSAPTTPPYSPSPPPWGLSPPRSEEHDLSSSEAPYLCQACLSVLTMDGLETGKPYPHHESLWTFLAACQMGCAMCSLPGTLHLEDWQDLAQGRVPKDMPADKDQDIDDDASSSIEEARREIEECWKYYTESEESLVSLTGLWISSNSPGSVVARVRLSPAYADFIPIGMKAYERALWDLWKLYANKMRARCNRIIITSHGTSRHGPNASRHSIANSTADLSRLGISTSLSCNTGSTETWSTVVDWARECSAKHQCLNHIDPCWYPTRVVERVSEQTFRVIRLEFALPRRGYITLSHQWRGDDFLKLTQDQLPDFERGLPITKLRKTFQEALVIANRMDIPYVWIDSLCIIQSGDDGADWQRECGTMSDVYSNSLCNLSADWGNEDNGLFFQRNAFGPTCEFQMKWKSEDAWWKTEAAEGTHQSPGWQSCCFVPRHKWIDNFLRSPLNRRGWVMQERLLAPRVLHFTPQQVSWECSGMLRSERWPKKPLRSPSLRSLSRAVENSGEEHRLMGRLELHDPSRALGSQRSLVDWWYARVSQYTACRLTKLSDKLIAIAGIAKKVRPFVHDQYVAGLWARSLPGASAWVRLWQLDRTAPISCQQTGYYVPSFSWAAADGYSQVPNHVDREESKFLLSVDFINYRQKVSSSTAEQQSPTGDEILTHDVLGLSKTPEVEIRAQGVLRSCRLLPPTDAKDLGDRRPVRLCPSIEGDAFHDRMFATYDRAVDWQAATDPTIHYYAPIWYKFTYDYRTTLWLEEGLLLRSVDASMGRFERVGHIAVGDGREDCPEIRPLGNERDLPAWSYDETTGDHIFYIV